MFYWWDYIWKDLGYTDGAADVKFEGLLIGAKLKSLDGIQVGCTEVNKLWIYCWGVVVTTLVIYYGTDLVLSQFSSDVTSYCKFEVSLYGLEIGTNEGTKLGLRYGLVLGTTLGAVCVLILGTYDGLDL